MCHLCEENANTYICCGSCGVFVCLDVAISDFHLATAYVSAQGDVVCETCGFNERTEDLNEI